LKELEDLGYTQRIASATQLQVMVPLKPNPRPVLPLARTLTLGRGWHLRPGGAGWRWAYEDEAALLYDNPTKEELKVDVTLTLSAPDTREVTISLDDVIVGRVAADPDGENLVMTGVSLEPGVNTLLLETEGEALRGAGGFLRSFGVKGIRVQPSAVQ